MSDDTRKQHPMIKLWINHTYWWDGCANFVHKCNRFLFVWRLLFLQIISVCTRRLNVQEFWQTQHVFKNATIFYFFGACFSCIFYLYILITLMPWNCKKMRMSNKLNAGSFVPLNDKVYAFNEWVQLLTYEMWRFQ